MGVLRSVKSLGLPDWCVCAGFVRSKVWDHLHEFDRPTRLADVDVVYFDAMHTDEATEKEYEETLCRLDGAIPWSVRNQARMHVKNGHTPYRSTADGVSKFPEVCTAIGVYIDATEEVRLVAPYGNDDLVKLIVRPTPSYTTTDKRDIFEQRMQIKQWQRTWRNLKIIHLKDGSAQSDTRG